MERLRWKTGSEGEKRRWNDFQLIYVVSTETDSVGSALCKYTHHRVSTFTILCMQNVHSFTIAMPLTKPNETFPHHDSLKTDTLIESFVARNVNLLYFMIIRIISLCSASNTCATPKHIPKMFVTKRTNSSEKCDFVSLKMALITVIIITLM